jgi:hypothetical protein
MDEKEIRQYLKDHLKLEHTLVGGMWAPYREAYVLMLDDEIISIAEGGMGR